MKKYLILVIVVAVIAIGGVVFQTIQLQTAQNLNLQSLATQTSQANAFSLTQAASQNDNANLQATLEARVTDIASIQAAQTKSAADYQKAQDDIVNLTKRLDVANGETIKEHNQHLNTISTLAAANKTLKCDTTTNIKFDYTSNATISENLKTFIGDISDKPTEATWDVIWSNARDAIHNIKGKYKYTFSVTFVDSKLSQPSNSIYWIGRNCFLDRQ
jgi:hypothetical protein